MSFPGILTPRLELVTLPPEFFVAILEGLRPVASSVADFQVPVEWPAETDAPWLRLRLSQLRQDPAIQPWLLRAVVPREGPRAMAGYIGFHSRPRDDGTVEFGYTVLPPYRRRGFAYEAAVGLMDWAVREHGVRRFILSVAPGNTPSRSLAQKLGFRSRGATCTKSAGGSSCTNSSVCDSSESHRCSRSVARAHWRALRILESPIDAL